MMVRTRKKLPVQRQAYLAIAATFAAAGLLLAGHAPLAAEPQWTASIESQAERAYRETYSRAFSAPPKRAGKTARRKTERKISQTAAPSTIPEMPQRNWEKSVPEIVASVDPEETTQAVPENDTTQPAPEASSEAALPQLRPLPDGAGEMRAAQAIGDAQGTSPAPPAAPAEARPAAPNSGEQFCSNVTDAARDARLAWQKQELQQAEQQVEGRVQELNLKIAEYQKWVARREEFSRKAQATITDIYSKMQPSAAAQQLMALDEETAAAVITKLNPRVSSALMAEMDPKQAARLTAIISASSKGPKGKPPAAPQSGGT